MSSRITAVLLAVAAFVAPVQAQSPTTIVVPAATAPNQPRLQPAAAAASNDAANILQQLQQMKAANEETIRKQEAVLQQLDELQKTAEQLRVFISRS